MVSTATPTEVTVQTDKTALIVVDMQNDFCHPDGALYAPASEAAIEPVNALTERVRDAGAEVIYTQDRHQSDQFENTQYYDEFERWGEHVLAGEWGCELHDDLARRPEDTVIQKPTYDAFHSTRLSDFMTNKHLSEVIVCGTLANVCVLHTASTAALHDYRPIIVEDALGYLEEADKEYAVNHADWLFGETTTVDQVSFE